LSESDFEGLLPAEVEAFRTFFGVATLGPILARYLCRWRSSVGNRSIKEFAVGGKKERDENEEVLFYMSEILSKRFK
jgi:hypothetical protein